MHSVSSLEAHAHWASARINAREIDYLVASKECFSCRSIRLRTTIVNNAILVRAVDTKMGYVRTCRNSPVINYTTVFNSIIERAFDLFIFFFFAMKLGKLHRRGHIRRQFRLHSHN